MLEELLDAAVGQTIELQLERGGKPLTVQLPVTDLHSVTPNAMLELAGGSVHALSYQQARNNRAVVGQVYVAEVRGCSFGQSVGWVVKRQHIVQQRGKLLTVQLL
jgi:hypothetical protein